MRANTQPTKLTTRANTQPTKLAPPSTLHPKPLHVTSKVMHVVRSLLAASVNWHACAHTLVPEQHAACPSQRCSTHTTTRRLLLHATERTGDCKQDTAAHGLASCWWPPCALWPRTVSTTRSMMPCLWPVGGTLAPVPPERCIVSSVCSVTGLPPLAEPACSGWSSQPRRMTWRVCKLCRPMLVAAPRSAVAHRSLLCAVLWSSCKLCRWSCSHCKQQQPESSRLQPVAMGRGAKQARRNHH